MDYVFDLIKSYGEWFYVITFIWTFFEGETFVIFAGLAAAHDILRLDLLILAAWSGSYCCDQTMFYLGRRFGPRILDRFPNVMVNDGFGSSEAGIQGSSRVTAADVPASVVAVSLKL